MLNLGKLIKKEGDISNSSFVLTQIDLFGIVIWW